MASSFKDRERGLAAGAALTVLMMGALALSGCMGSPRRAQKPSRPVPKAASHQPVSHAEYSPEGAFVAPVQDYAAGGPHSPVRDTVIGSGPVKVALILPLSGSSQGAAVAQSMRNAAELAVGEFPGADLSVLVKDDRGTPEGAREAAHKALAEGAQLILGPLFAGSVQAAGQVAREAGKPLIGFSSDRAAATQGVYLLSFMVQAEVDRIVAYAASQNRRSLAALIPDTTYGHVAEAQMREAAAENRIRIVAVERYPAGQPYGAVSRLGAIVGGPSPQADALFIPDNGDGLPAVAQALRAVRFNAQQVKPLGTGLWDEARVFALPGLQGGWFAAPDKRGFTDFAARYRARFGNEPVRLATLSYDAVTLAAALARMQGPQAYNDSVLTNGAGFDGADGVFRLNPNGTNDRALTVQEVRGGTAAVISTAPRTLMASY
ncbi:penicillin-binding protein activator [Microvirga makkahensis]|uniref:ABC transporter substrate-binding protein n=1 Tax=Microvirga makkahensis TaxID=1128670 RepID=A0A7X3SNT2_9HYPH|nr:penicillin-binding protein activator [Microvirga makkahensis]MXQ11523.1 ABC transporter substrate-binding protein [Microvirga makkahensis]